MAILGSQGAWFCRACHDLLAEGFLLLPIRTAVFHDSLAYSGPIKGYITLWLGSLLQGITPFLKLYFRLVSGRYMRQFVRFVQIS